MGEFYSGCRRHDEAVGAFRKAIAWDTTNAMLHWNLALAYRNAGRDPEAIRSRKAAMNLGLDPSLERYAKTLLFVLRGDARD